MKRAFVLLPVIVFACFVACAQQTRQPAASAVRQQEPQEVLQLKESAFDFGKIPQGRPVTHYFEVVNKGKAPLVLDNVQASCGCTTPEWNEAPIASGSASTIKVGFNAASEGHFTKTITIIYNNGQTKTFTISGEVYPSPTTSAPLNTSLSLLK